MDRLKEMEAFVTVLDQGGFTDAAAKLSMSKSAVSKHVSSLENRLGARLLNRTTRRVSATEIGLSFYDRARLVLDAALDATDSVAAMQEAPRGNLRLAVPVSFGVRHASRAINSFLQAHPDVSVEIELADTQTNLVEAGIDVAIRVGNLQDSSLLARRIATTRMMVVASPEYLVRNGTPQSIDDLNQHALLHYKNQTSGNHWQLISQRGEERQIRVRGPLVANNGDVLLQAAIDGLGIGFFPDFFTKVALEKKQLVEVLQQLNRVNLGIHIVYPPGKFMQPKTRTFIDFMVSYFARYDPAKN